jgi:hypothetical protein
MVRNYNITKAAKALWDGKVAAPTVADAALIHS